MSVKQITSIEQFKKLAQSETGLDCFIYLKGCMKSSKHIFYYPEDNTFSVFNFIDDSEEELTEKQILDDTYGYIGEALREGALYYYD